MECHLGQALSGCTLFLWYAVCPIHWSNFLNRFAQHFGYILLSEWNAASACLHCQAQDTAQGQVFTTSRTWMPDHSAFVGAERSRIKWCWLVGTIYKATHFMHFGWCEEPLGKEPLHIKAQQEICLIYFLRSSLIQVWHGQFLGEGQVGSAQMG